MANVLSVPHFSQTVEGSCLPACAQMVLAYLGEKHSQATLARQLGTRPHIGTPHRNINRLRSVTIDVRYAAEGTLDILHASLAQQLPIIVFVQTAELPHWQGHTSRHTLVVVGETETAVWVLDPAMPAEPISVPSGDFLLAWEEMDATYAVLQPIKK